MNSYLKHLTQNAQSAQVPRPANVYDFRAGTAPASPTSQAAEIRTLAGQLIERLQFMRQAGITFNGDRDLYEILGYSRVLTNKDMRDRYARGGIAKRIVEAMPKATWRGGIEILEGGNPSKTKPPSDKKTALEQAVLDLNKKFKIWSVLQRTDILSRLSTYAVLLIGAPGRLTDPLPKGKPNQLLYFTPFCGGGGPNLNSIARQAALDADAVIQTYEQSAQSPRFGLPLTYQLRRINFSTIDLMQPVHWTRLVHVAENCLDDEVFGQPALEAVWNLLDDLDKVTGGGAEAFWLRANQGLHLDFDKDMKDVGPAALEKLKNNLDEYKHGIDRVLRTRGVTAKTLGSDTANFASPSDAILTLLAGTTSIPKRILTGSEMGELASSQDRDNWKDQVNGRQTGHAEPNIVRPLFDRLIEFGYLPPPAQSPDDYEVKFAHMQVLTEQEKSTGAKLWADAKTSDGDPVFTIDEIRSHWYGLDPMPEDDTEFWRAALASKMALSNKTQGLTIFTPKEIRKTAYGWEPLSPEEEVPIGAPERISVKEPPPEPGRGGAAVPVVDPKTGKPVESSQPRAAQEEDELTSVLEAAILAGNKDVVNRILGFRDTEHKFSSTQVQLPPLVAQALLGVGWGIPYDELNIEAGGREQDAHITVKYGLHTDSSLLVQSLLKGYLSINTHPLEGSLGPLDIFEHEEYDVLFASVDSKCLEGLNKFISENFEVTDTHSGYKPHATIAYLKPGEGAKYVGRTDVVGLTFSTKEITFSSGDDVKTVISLD